MCDVNAAPECVMCDVNAAPECVMLWNDDIISHTHPAMLALHSACLILAGFQLDILASVES
jgi:hypothetical protein